MKSVKHLAACGAALGALLMLVWSLDRPATSPDPGAAPATAHESMFTTPDLAAASLPTIGQAASPAAAVAAFAGSRDRVLVGRNDTLDSIFRRMSLSMIDLASIRRLPGVRRSLDLLIPGDAVEILHTDAEVQGLTRKVSDTSILQVTRSSSGFAAAMVENPVETRVRTAGASIATSLFQAAEAARISDPVALKLANVFAWDIDFVLDIREGDHFTAVYERLYQEGKYLRDGELLAAEFVNHGRVYRAVRFVSDTGAVGYYAPDGRPMRKAFLRAPVDFTRVSSAFNPHRLHPILNTIRGHMGTDYAAPIGTPVHAAGDGRVSFAGTRGGYGNAVMLSHAANISTLYGHLSRFARSARVGVHVRQGEVIGYVGMTGLATGPHLHYEYLLNGVHRDPQTVQLPGAEPLRADAMQEFRSSSAPLLAALNPTPQTQAPADESTASTATPGAAPRGAAP